MSVLKAKPFREPRISEGEYLRMERASVERHEYFDGRIVAMAGESPIHGEISFNLAGIIFAHLRGKPCRGRTKDTKVRSGPVGPWDPRSTSGLYSYPDIVVICDESEYLDENTDVITNPTVIVEVLSPNTETYDRGEKFQRYRQWNPTLTEYVLVSQDRPILEMFTRRGEGNWHLSDASGLDASIEIPSIGCVLKLADVYDRVEFPNEELSEEG